MSWEKTGDSGIWHPKYYITTHHRNWSSSLHQSLPIYLNYFWRRPSRTLPTSFPPNGPELNNNKPAKRSIHWKTKNNYIQHNYVTHNKIKHQIVHRYTAATSSLTVVYIHTQLEVSLSPHRPSLQRDSMYACLIIYITWNINNHCLLITTFFIHNNQPCKWHYSVWFYNSFKSCSE